ncbi:uncharacterized protein [Ptychodera flava]|uniref:uncharacterized protein isoform X2 n=1 Tax=Ptychodera flava TaxID=63121 RepID=UPI00396A8949
MIDEAADGLGTYTVRSTEISSEIGDVIALPCKYDTPLVEYSRITIDWRKESPGRFSLTLLTIIDFSVNGVVDPRYSAKEDGSLIIRNVTLEDTGSYKCIVVFRLNEPVDGIGYHTEVDKVNVTVKSTIRSVSVYPKLETENGLAKRKKGDSTLVCKAENSTRPAADVLHWKFDNSQHTRHKIIYFDEQTTDGKMNVFSELTLKPPRHAPNWYNVSCSVLEGKSNILTSSLLVYMDPRQDRRTKKLKKRGRAGREKSRKRKNLKKLRKEKGRQLKQQKRRKERQDIPAQAENLELSDLDQQ